MDKRSAQEADDGRSDEELDGFIRSLTESQSRLYAYLVASLGNYDDAGDVLQKTNIALWRKAREFRTGAEFMPWAVAVARYEVLAFYRDRGRDKHVFSQELALKMLDTTAKLFPEHSPRQDALRECMPGLPAASREMIKLRYNDGATLLQISQKLNRTENAVKFALVRIRKSLAKCIKHRIQLRG